MTSATEELRRMLDERGVEYETYTEQLTGFEHVKWSFGPHGSADFNLEFGSPWLTMYGEISGPEQAVAATLGRGECEMNVLDTGNEAAYEHYEYIMHCENCHHEFGYVQYNEDGDTWMDDKPRFCPNCGAKVVDA